MSEIAALPIAKDFVFNKQNGEYYKQLNSILKVWNYRINRQDGISFLFDDEAVKDVRHYVHSDEEAAAAIVAPYVLKRGKIITGHKNHKNKGLVSITIAAPVRINGQLAYEGVAVKFDQKDRVHSLRIVDTNGNQFVLYKQEKTKSSTNRAGSEKSESDLPSNFSSKNSVSQAESENNSFSKKSSDRFAQSDTDYLSAVERGDMETAQKMVDEAARAAGYDMHLYHGSKSGGGFTVFNGWQYFTESKPYAERYTQRNTGKGLYNVFVKSSRLFDTRKPADRALFKQYRNEYGMGGLQESGLPDWTDGYDLSDIIEENDLDYDGIILDEGGDLVNGKPVSRGVSCVIRSSEQIKSADPVTYYDDGNVIPLSERFKTEQKDIRYSDRIYGLGKRKTFPPYYESHSDANEWAMRWARLPDVFAGDQRLASYHQRWYIIEKFFDKLM